jgi:hypothetical protein
MKTKILLLVLLVMGTYSYGQENKTFLLIEMN